MSDAKDVKEAPKDAAKPAEGAALAKKGLPVKVIGIVAAMMAVEAGAVFFFVKATSPKAAMAEEAHLEHADQNDTEATVEIQLIEDKFQNLQTGRVWIWDTEIYLKVKKKNEEFVNKVLESKNAEIKEGVAMIFRRAQHSQLKEPGLETINRQLMVYVGQVIGKDPDGKERIEKIFLPKCRGFPAD